MSDIAIENIEKKCCDEDQTTYFIFSKLGLETGYKYQFIFQFGDSADQHVSHIFNLQGIYYFILIDILKFLECALAPYYADAHTICIAIWNFLIVIHFCQREALLEFVNFTFSRNTFSSINDQPSLRML